MFYTFDIPCSNMLMIFSCCWTPKHHPSGLASWRWHASFWAFRCHGTRQHGDLRLHGLVGTSMSSVGWWALPQRNVLTLRVIICLEKLFYKIFFVILIWFCYGFVMVSLWLILCFFCLSSKQLWFRYGFVMVLECFIFFLWNLLWLVVSFL